MELCSFQEMQNRFEVCVEQTFTQWHNRLREAEEQGNVTELYYLIKYHLPEDVRNWVQAEARRSGLEVADVIRGVIAVEEERDHCECCTHHQEVLERVQLRLDNIPAVEYPVVGPNHLFNQAFSAFGLICGGIYVGTSYLHGVAWLEPARIIVSAAAGLTVGIMAYGRYRQLYRKEFREQGEHFLEEQKRRIREWFDQIISLSENEAGFRTG